MAIPAFVLSTPYRRLSLKTIDAVVSARLGPTRVQGNAQPACVNRQIAMYLAKHVAGWSTTCIGRYYHGRDHSTVIHGIQRIEALRQSDPDVDSLIRELKRQLERQPIEESENNERSPKLERISKYTVEELAELVAERVYALLQKRIQGAGEGDAEID